MHLTADQIRRLVAPFDIDLDAHQTEQISAWTDLLIKWNAKINLTTITKPEEIITRHFAESMYLSKAMDLRGRLLDVGSGAGFPALALKITDPDLQVVLLEPVGKKRAFLKEAIRECGFNSVEVLAERVEDYSTRHSGEFDLVTARALGSFDSTLPAMVRCLRADGELRLWLTRSEGESLSKQSSVFGRLVKWSQPIPVPLSRDREIWHGKPIG